MFNIQQATSHVSLKLAEAKQFINDQYNHPDAELLRLRVNSDLDRLQNSLQFLSGGDPVINTEASATSFLQPLKEFMGEPIVYAKQVASEDINPNEADKQFFLNKVNKLYQEIDAMMPDAVLNTYTIPEDQLVLRGVAKKAGVSDYADRPLNEAFVTDIVKAKQDKKDMQQQEEEFEHQLAEQNGNPPNMQVFDPNKEQPDDDDKKPEVGKPATDDATSNAIANGHTQQGKTIKAPKGTGK